MCVLFACCLVASWVFICSVFSVWVIPDPGRLPLCIDFFYLYTLCAIYLFSSLCFRITLHTAHFYRGVGVLPAPACCISLALCGLRLFLDWSILSVHLRACGVSPYLLTCLVLRFLYIKFYLISLHSFGRFHRSVWLSDISI